MDWTDKRVTELKDDWAAGHSAGQIAAMYQVTRSTIMGKIMRLGLPSPAVKLPVLCNGRPRGAPRPRTAPVRAGTRAPRPWSGKPGPKPWEQPIKIPKVKTSKPWESEQLEATELPEEQAAHAVALIDFESYHCRWPVRGEPAELFCGSDKIKGYSYCARHCRMAYRRGPNVSEEERARRMARFRRVHYQAIMLRRATA